MKTRAEHMAEKLKFTENCADIRHNTVLGNVGLWYDYEDKEEVRFFSFDIPSSLKSNPISHLAVFFHLHVVYQFF